MEKASLSNRKHVGSVISYGRGFNLLELMVALTIMLLIAGLSSPKIAEQYVKWQLYTNSDTLFQNLKTARVEALIKAVNVTVCPSSDGKKCINDWRQPILGFIDPSKTLQLTKPQLLIFRIEAIHNLTSNRRSLSFAPIHSVANTAATLKFCSDDESSKWRRAIVVSTTGRIRMELEPSKVSC